MIAGNMFAESASESLRGLLFVYGLFLFIVVVLFNALVKIIFREKKTTKQNVVVHAIGEGLKFIPRQLRKL
ncbi:MAG: hypothetical protein MJ200_04310 [Mycoplasmoidaceae bacterium]|nr:hypothetical protein [Mycoplasmoidaceae bacterium]